MARNFLDEDAETPARLSYGDGFRFGFGFFIAQLLGTTAVGLIAFGVTLLLHQLRG